MDLDVIQYQLIITAEFFSLTEETSINNRTIFVRISEGKGGSGYAVVLSHDSTLFQQTGSLRMRLNPAMTITALQIKTYVIAVFFPSRSLEAASFPLSLS